MALWTPGQWQPTLQGRRGANPGHLVEWWTATSNNVETTTLGRGNLLARAERAALGGGSPSTKEGSTAVAWPGASTGRQLRGEQSSGREELQRRGLKRQQANGHGVAARERRLDGSRAKSWGDGCWGGRLGLTPTQREAPWRRGMLMAPSGGLDVWGRGGLDGHRRWRTLRG